MERRQYSRLEIKAPCRIHRAGAPGVVRAVTQNISRNGLLISLAGAGASAPRSGDFWTIDVDLPPSEGFGRRCLRCAGTVTRVIEQPGGGWVVALSIWNMAFRDPRKGAVSEAGEMGSGPQILWPLM